MAQRNQVLCADKLRMAAVHLEQNNPNMARSIIDLLSDCHVGTREKCGLEICPVLELMEKINQYYVCNASTAIAKQELESTIAGKLAKIENILSRI